MTAETKFKTQVMRYLNQIGAYTVKQHGNMFTKKGVPDLLICLKGRFIALELKAENGKPSELQIYQIYQIKQAGGISLVLYPKDFELLKQICEEVLKCLN